MPYKINEDSDSSQIVVINTLVSRNAISAQNRMSVTLSSCTCNWNNLSLILVALFKRYWRRKNTDPPKINWNFCYFDLISFDE